jgi:hypothetical protein
MACIGQAEINGDALLREQNSLYQLKPQPAVSEKAPYLAVEIEDDQRKLVALFQGMAYREKDKLPA